MRQMLRKTGVFLSGLMMMGFVAAGSVQAVVLTFDDVPGGSIQNDAAFMPNGSGAVPTYKGFIFTGGLSWIDVEDSPEPHGARSGDFAILNSLGEFGTIREGTGADFTFDGLWAKEWGMPPNSGGAENLFGALAGFNNGSLVWAVSTGLNGSCRFYGAQAGAIDKLRLDLGNTFLVDDISLNASPVPSPSAMLLFGSGLAALAAWRHKARRMM